MKTGPFLFDHVKLLSYASRRAGIFSAAQWAFFVDAAVKSFSVEVVAVAVCIPRHVVRPVSAVFEKSSVHFFLSQGKHTGAAVSPA